MKTRAVTKTSRRQSSMTSRRRRSALPAVSRKTSARVAAGRAASRTGRRRRVGEAAGKLRSSSRASRSAKMTTDHDEIRRWVEARGGTPATVKRTTRGKQAAGVLRIDFPGFSGEGTLKPVSWDQWFQVFDKRNLAFLYQQKSRFNKLVSRKK